MVYSDADVFFSEDFGDISVPFISNGLDTKTWKTKLSWHTWTHLIYTSKSIT